MAIKRWNSSTNTWDAFGSAQINVPALGITPSTVGAVNITNGTVSTASTSLGVVRNTFASTSAPTSGQGSDGDVWMLYV